MGRYSACIVGINIGTLLILENLSKIINDILIVTSSKVDMKNKIKLIDIVPHIFMKNKDQRCTYLISDRYYKLITTFEVIEVDDLSSVIVNRDRIYVNNHEIHIKRDFIICGDEVTKIPPYADTDLIRDLCSGNMESIVLDGSDVFKILEFYLLFRDLVDVKISENVREKILEIPHLEEISFSDSSYGKKFIIFELSSDKPLIRHCSCKLFKVDNGRVVRDLELLLRAFLFLYSGFSRELKIDLAISDKFCIIHIGDLLSKLRSRFREVSLFRSCVDHDGCRVCSRVACFEDLFLCSDIYCTSFSCLSMCEPLFYFYLSNVCKFLVPCVFSIYSMYSGLPIYTPAYSYALSRALLRLEKEFK